MSLRRLGTCLVAGALLACGGKLAPIDDGSGPSDAGTTPSFGVVDAYVLPPVHCVRCTADEQCGGPQYACVARDEGHGGYCMAGCSKDGFCLAGQQCVWVKDPEGHDWRACLPSNDDCGH